VQTYQNKALVSVGCFQGPWTRREVVSKLGLFLMGRMITPLGKRGLRIDTPTLQVLINEYAGPRAQKASG
jgi:hypothetical protein